jgi:HAD superfamily hydrolase (TIGR01549 family)
MTIEWVILDVGETLIDETRVWATWARHLGVSPLTFAAALGAVIAIGDPHQSVFDRLGVPDWRHLIPAVDDDLGDLRATDLYPDALAAERALRDRGYRTALIANQPARRHAELLALGFAPDVIAMSEAMGVAKPGDGFYRQALELLGNPDPRRVVHVGDRVDNDVVPARRNGLRSVWIRRGPWGRLQADVNGDADLVIANLDDLVRRLPELDA